MRKTGRPSRRSISSSSDTNAKALSAAIRCAVPHPKGEGALDLRLEGGRWTGTASVPPGVPAVLVLDGAERAFEGTLRV